MKRFKKIFAMLLTFAMILGIAGVQAPETAAYAADSKITLTVDYVDYMATIKTSGADAYLFLEVLKKKGEEYTVSATYTFKTQTSGQDKLATVDLSFLKATSEQYIRAYGNLNTEAKSDIVTVQKQPDKSSIKYVPADTLAKSFTIKSGKEELNVTDEILAEYVYRTLYGTTWIPLDEFDPANSVAGTTLIVRKEAVAAEDKIVGAPAGNEVKVKIAALAKAPKVTPDYVNGVVKLAKGTEYRVIYLKDTTPTEVSTYKEVGSSAQSLTPAEIILNTVTLTGDDAAKAKAAEDIAKKGFTLIVRTAKTDKKAASAPVFVTIPAQPAVTDNSDTSTISLTGDTAKNVTYKDTEKGLELKATGATFAYSIDGGEKWKTVAAGKTAVVKMDTGKTVLVRLAGVKADTKKKIEGTLPSNSIAVTYTKPTPTAAPTPTKA